MLTRQQIEHQRTLLKTARDHLAVLLNQHLSFGAYVPPYIVTEIVRYRAEITQIKQVLGDAGVPVDDAPNDEAASNTVDAVRSTSAGSSSSAAQRESAIPGAQSPHSSETASATPDTPQNSSHNSSASVVRIMSVDTENTDFGTGFVIARDAAEDVAFVVTCAHVVRSVKPAPMIYMLPATIVAIDESERIDLAVLRVVGLDEITPLETQHSVDENCTVTIPGWSRYGKHPRLLSLDAKLDRKTYIDGTAPRQRLDAWAVAVSDTCNYPLQGGYSGAPVIDPDSGKVVAVVYLAEDNGKRGMAVSISALALIWSDMPETQCTCIPTSTPDLIQTPVPPIVHVYLAAHQRLRGIAHGQSDEIVIDWTQMFVSDDPDTDIWEQKLIPDLERHMQSFRRNEQKRIALRADARNTAGLVFGYVFCERSGFHIQYTDREGSIWYTDDAGHTPSPVNRSETTVRKKGTDTIVELAVTQGVQSVRVPVDARITSERLPVRKRIMLELPDKPLRITPGEGNVIARQVCDIISDEAIPGGIVHIFGALPLGIAILIGWSLKAGRTVQWYELDLDQNYRPTCLLRT